MIAAVTLSGCASTVHVDDPLEALADQQRTPPVHLAAMEQLDASTGETDQAYLQRLRRLMWVPGFTVRTREAALERLERRDLPGLLATIERRLPTLSALLWRARLCEIIGERGWVELTRPLIRAWAARPGNDVGVREWPEYAALAELHGVRRVVDTLFEVFVETQSIALQGLRTRCWELMHRLGERERLVELVRTATTSDADWLLRDLQRAANELGIVPHTREEILWIRNLCAPEMGAFWSEATQALADMTADRRAKLEMRDLSVAVAAQRHEPELLSASTNELFDRLFSAIRDRKHYSRDTSPGELSFTRRDRLHNWRHALTWGDLAAMHLAIRAIAVPQVVDHLFDYAQRDRDDRSTEYGGIIDLDDKGRFQVLEFLPRRRQHDQKFIAPQAMFDAGYTALFHFHLHVQRTHNADYAGPGDGDDAYATSTRANCLVLTSVSADRMNIDFYRHGGLTVDLGSIDRSPDP